MNPGKIVGSTGQPSSSIIWNVLFESFAMATQLRAKMPYGAARKNLYLCFRFFLLQVYLLSSGISIRNVNLSPIRTVSTSRVRESRIRILGGGASGADVMLIISGSLKNADFGQLSVSVQVLLPDGHHAECDILGRHIVGAFDFVDFISFGHDNAVMLKNHRIGIDASLKRLNKRGRVSV